MMIYVASSWRNHMQGAIVHTLRAARFEVYDFKNPPNGKGFGWQEVMPSFNMMVQECPEEEYLVALQHPRAIEGFNSDFDAMQACDTCVLVLPCGKSAHLELGWFVGQGRRTIIVLDGPQVQPELMYKMVDHIVPGALSLLSVLGVAD